MVDFTKRLQEIIKYYGESASSFAEKIGVQRSSISHILSGRNKPSLDFILKIRSAYPEVNLYWLLNNEGPFLSQKPLETFESKISPPPPPLSQNKLTPKKDKAIERIVIFYSDGSFKNFED